MEKYLEVIFPGGTDWVHDQRILKEIPCTRNPEGKIHALRPDWRSESLNLIVEIGGLPHYTSPIQILLDRENSEYYESLGCKIVRSPFFIQLTRQAVKELFAVKVKVDLFDGSVASMREMGYNPRPSASWRVSVAWPKNSTGSLTNTRSI